MDLKTVGLLNTPFHTIEVALGGMEDNMAHDSVTEASMDSTSQFLSQRILRSDVKEALMDACSAILQLFYDNRIVSVASIQEHFTQYPANKVKLTLQALKEEGRISLMGRDVYRLRYDDPKMEQFADEVTRTQSFAIAHFKRTFPSFSKATINSNYTTCRSLYSIEYLQQLHQDGMLTLRGRRYTLDPRCGTPL